ncbi:MAG TPA: hypothetical protein VFW71_06905 [Actinomycetota bacterium]|nr:hypothetical protein [Actinomycetota bacterium]
MARLDDLIDEALAHPPAGPAPIEMLEQRGRARRRRRQMAAVIAAVLLLAGGIGALVGLHGHTQVLVVTGQPPSWRVLPDEAGVRGPAVWTGREVLFVGRAFDPSTATWRDLALPPFAGDPDGVQGLGVWTGSQMILLDPGASGAALPTSDTATFDPATNSWRLLARSPLAGQVPSLAVWTGRSMIVLATVSGTEGGTEAAQLDGATYDPAGNAWRALPPNPLACAFPPLAGWTGAEMIVMCDVGPGQQSAAAYRPSTGAWTSLPNPVRAIGDDGRAVWTGKALMVWTEAGGQAYDPSTNAWQALPAAPLAKRADASVVWTGRTLIVWGGELDGPAGARVPTIGDKYLSDGAMYDPTTRAWTALPPVGVIGRYRATAVWTGSTVFIWGGRGYGQTRDLASGALYTPGR